jgi:hypothetical protein
VASGGVARGGGAVAAGIIEPDEGSEEEYVEGDENAEGATDDGDGDDGEDDGMVEAPGVA